MSEANKVLVRRWFDEVWNKGHEAAIDELFAADGVAHGLGDTDTDVHGPAEFTPFVRNLRGAIPDRHIAVEDLLAEGDKVAVRVRLRGTHGSDGLGIPATGRPVNVAGVIIVRVVNGKIFEGWNSWDQLGLLRQTGALARMSDSDQFLTARD